MRSFKEYAEEREFVMKVATIMVEQNINPVEFIENCIKESQPQLLNEVGLLNRMGNWFQKAGNAIGQAPAKIGSYLDRQSAIGGIEISTSLNNAYHYLNNALAVMREYNKKDASGKEIVPGVGELSQVVLDAMKKLYPIQQKAERVEVELKNYAYGKQRMGNAWQQPPEMKTADAPVVAQLAPTQPGGTYATA